MTEEAKTETNAGPPAFTPEELRKRLEKGKAEISAIANAMLDAIPEGTQQEIVISATMTAACRMCQVVGMPLSVFMETMASLVEEASAIEAIATESVSAQVGTTMGVPAVAVDRLRRGLDETMMKTLMYLAMRLRKAEQTRTHSIAMMCVEGTPGTARIVSFEEVRDGAIGPLLSAENLARVKDDPSMKEDEIRVIAITEVGAGIAHLAIEKMRKAGEVIA